MAGCARRPRTVLREFRRVQIDKYFLISELQWLAASRAFTFRGVPLNANSYSVPDADALTHLISAAFDIGGIATRTAVSELTSANRRLRRWQCRSCASGMP